VFKKIFFLLLFVYCGSNILAAQNLQDVVYLKNGSIIHGTIIEQIPNVSIKIERNNGDVDVVKIEDISKMTKERVAEATEASSTYTSNASNGTAGVQKTSNSKSYSEFSCLIGNGFQDGYNFGLGGRWTFPVSSSMFLGITYVYYFGEDANYYDDYYINTHVDVSTIGADIGFNVPVSSTCSFRPYFEPGYALVSASVTATDDYSYGSASASDGYFYMAPGIALQWHLAGGFAFGFDARYTILTETSGSNAFSLFGTIGFSY